MTYLPPTTAIFSPSIARAAASAARDWAFLDSWLARLFASRPVPPFERNVDTLQALLALASANEAADEERDALARAEAASLRALQDSACVARVDDARSVIFRAVEAALPREGAVALEAMARSAVSLDAPLADPAAIGRHMVSLSARSMELAQAEARVSILRRHLERCAAELTVLTDTWTRHLHSPPDLARQNLEMQRQVKVLTARLLLLRERASTQAARAGTPDVTIERARAEEERYGELLARKRELDVQVRAFQGLPPDRDQARKELEGLRRELRLATERRDGVFEGLVERETPRKPRRR